VKGCEKYQQFEVHPAHPWERRPGWPLFCEGILPEDEQPPCGFYVSPEQPTCGEPAPVTVRVKTKIIDTKVPLCRFHKRKHSNMAAQRRAEYTESHRQAS
jgi:hypothetical protein